MPDEITVTLTRDEADALLHSWSIEEYPHESRAEAAALETAEAKLRAALSGGESDGE